MMLKTEKLIYCRAKPAFFIFKPAVKFLNRNGAEPSHALTHELIRTVLQRSITHNYLCDGSEKPNVSCEDCLGEHQLGDGMW